MPKPEHVMTVATEWVSKAENDLKNAANTLKMGDQDLGSGLAIQYQVVRIMG
ncbi:MAG: hypothetical protein AABY41_00370 [Nitrospirota bacterium]